MSSMLSVLTIPLIHALEVLRERLSCETAVNVLFNDALNTFYLQLYGVRHMVKDHSVNEKGNQQGFFYMYHPTDRITHTTAFITQVIEHWLERQIAQWVHHEGLIPGPIAPFLPNSTVTVVAAQWRLPTKSILFHYSLKKRRNYLMMHPTHFM